MAIHQIAMKLMDVQSLTGRPIEPQPVYGSVEMPMAAGPVSQSESS